MHRKKLEIKLTDEIKLGPFWIFDRNMPGAGRGRWFDVQCAVYEEI